MPRRNEDALYVALKEKRLAGAALDVYEQEPPPQDSPLLEFDNVITTSHMGTDTEESICIQQSGHLLKEVVIRHCAPEVAPEPLDRV